MVTYATGDLVEAGSDALVETGELIPRYIINFPTKRRWRTNSRLGDIESRLSAVVAGVEQRRIRSIDLQPLGCRLDWTVGNPLIHAAFSKLPYVETTVYGPASRSAHPSDAGHERRALTSGRSAYRPYLQV